MRSVVVAVLLVAACALTEAQDRRTLTRDDAPSRRLALVIGNDTYARSPLRNGRNDARAMAGLLRKLSFDVVVVEDATRASMGAALRSFSSRITPSDLAMVFYAGHGNQVEGVNYLIPVDFDGNSEDEVRFNAIASDEFTRALSRARVGVLILDACRDNPYSGSRSGGRGLAQLEAKGMLVAFATGAGQTASDGQGSDNGVFTSELVQLLGQPGRGLRDTFFEVQRRVQRTTNGRQFPAVYSQLIDDVILTPTTEAAGTAAPPVSAPAGPSAAELALRAELEFWDGIKNSDNVALFRDYLNRYPAGQFRAIAAERIRVATAASSGGSSSAPPKPSGAPPPANRTSGGRSADETRDIDAVVAMVDWVMTGNQVTSDMAITLEPYFLKSQDQRAFVPFVLTVTNPPRSDAVVYIRVVDPAQKPNANGRVEYPWDDVHFVPASQLTGNPARLSRVFMAPAGTYDVYVAVKDRGADAPRGTVRKEQVTVPNFHTGRMIASSVVIADRVTMLSAALEAEQARERPFVFGSQELHPSPDRAFRKTQELAVFFQVYNAALRSGKPDIVIEYDFYRVDASAKTPNSLTPASFFNRTAPQLVNASNLPAQFDHTRFPVPGGITVPLSSFPAGHYRLMIKVTDKVANTTWEPWGEMFSVRE